MEMQRKDIATIVLLEVKRVPHTMWQRQGPRVQAGQAVEGPTGTKCGAGAPGLLPSCASEFAKTDFFEMFP